MKFFLFAPLIYHTSFIARGMKTGLFFALQFWTAKEGKKRDREKKAQNNTDYRGKMANNATGNGVVDDLFLARPQGLKGEKKRSPVSLD